jgi:HlyD family secretion protein
MNRRQIIITIAVILGAAAAITALSSLVSHTGRQEGRVLQGYAEGRFRLISPEETGLIVDLAIKEGDHVETGALIARLDDMRETAGLAQAESAAKAAQSRFDDAAAGGREPEIQAAREVLTQAEAAARDAHNDLDRVRPLFARGVSPRSDLDQAEQAVRSADAHVAETRQQLTLIELPARENLLMALDSDARAAEAAVTVARKALNDRAVYAPSPGKIDRVLRRPGEAVGPEAPVARFLPDGDMIAVVFAPETIVSTLTPGERLNVSCDACPAVLSAVITNISSQAEFTPPIIYSDRERSRLVFRVEARFAEAAPPSGTPLQARRAPTAVDVTGSK